MVVVHVYKTAAASYHNQRWGQYWLSYNAMGRGARSVRMKVTMAPARRRTAPLFIH